ncbi:hypothetical protein BU15DRAFT_74334 [Melanogaster broomeanus]|nr:hypothetical protein BU15DRAFT_74334 [Melanogaster broomeanus]
MSFPWVSADESVKTGSAADLSSRPTTPGKRRARRPSLTLMLNALPPRVIGTSSNAPSQQTPLPPRTPRSPPVFPFFRDLGSHSTPALHKILPQLPPVHARFFELLDAEIEKIEAFYAEREKEMYERGKLLREQLNELGIHRQKFYESAAHSPAPSWAKKATFRF